MDAALDARMGYRLGPHRCPGEIAVPPGVFLEDGLTEDEAIAVALWNNAAYQELLAQLGISRAQLIEAGLLTDPVFTTLLPIGEKQLEFTFMLALDAIWLRPIRVRAAELDVGMVSQQMVQHGLDLVRDVRLAFADLLFVQQRAMLGTRAVDLRSQIARLAESRLRAGDISELETIAVRLGALQAKADAARFAQEVSLAEDRLKALLGLPLFDVEITAVESLFPPAIEWPPGDLVHEALAMRPDLRAAELAIEAAGVRSGIERRQCISLAGLIDANGAGAGGFEIGPGAELRIPIFNGNRGQMALADANLQRAMRAYVTVRDRIVLDVRTAHTQALQAQENLALVRRELLPALEAAGELARRNYERGEAPYFLVLETTGQFLESSARELELQAALRRAVAQLERSVGRRFLTGSRPLPPMFTAPPPGEEVPLPAGSSALPPADPM